MTRHAPGTLITDGSIFGEHATDLSALTAANKTRELIGDVTLLYCPICLEDIGTPTDDQCPLCKTHSGNSKLTGGRIRFSLELKHQIEESSCLIEERKNKVQTLRHKLKELVRSRNKTLGDLRAFIAPTSKVSSNVSNLLKHYGYLTRLIEDLSRLEGLQTEVTTLEKEVAEIQSTLEAIERELKQRQKTQEARRNHCQERIGDLTIQILHEDIVDKNNDTLNDAKGLVFSFDKDFLSVRSGRLSASTQAFLKNSFYLGLLKFAAEDPDSRLPNFFILDNIEDKGMVPDRFRKFHHLVVEFSETLEIPHQVILTTSYIDEELESSPYCVGPSYNAPPYTLDLDGEWGHFRNEEKSLKDG